MHNGTPTGKPTKAVILVSWDPYDHCVWDCMIACRIIMYLHLARDIFERAWIHGTDSSPIGWRPQSRHQVSAAVSRCS